MTVLVLWNNEMLVSDRKKDCNKAAVQKGIYVFERKNMLYPSFRLSEFFSEAI